MKLGGNFLSGLSRFVQGLLCSQVSPIIGIYFPNFYALDPAFASCSPLYKIGQVYFENQYRMWTYYSGFCLTEAQMIISGFGFSI